MLWRFIEFLLCIALNFFTSLFQFKGHYRITLFLLQQATVILVSVFVVVAAVLGIEPKNSHILSKHSTTNLYSQPFLFLRQTPTKVCKMPQTCYPLTSAS